MLLRIDAITAETDAPKLIEATPLSMFVKLAQAKQDVIAGLSTKGRDSRVRRKRAATLIDFWAQLHMVQNITLRLFDSLTHELNFDGQPVEQLANEPKSVHGRCSSMWCAGAGAIAQIMSFSCPH